MAKEKSIVEDAIIQMKNLEEAVAENAKGILASTMKEEIKELVKESLNEQGEEEVDAEVDIEEPETDDEEGDIEEPETDDEEGEIEEPETDDEEGDEMATDTMGMGVGSEMGAEEPIDLTDKSDEEVLRVFQLMGPDDGIIVTKDEAGNINLKDNEKEYMIVGESDLERGLMDEELEEEIDYSFMGDAGIDAEGGEYEESIDSIVERVFSEEDSIDGYTGVGGDGDGEGFYNPEMEEMYNELEEESDSYNPEMEEMYNELEEEDYDGSRSNMGNNESVVYEISLDDNNLEEDFMLEAKKKKTMSMKPKGRVGHGPKFSYETGKGGFKTIKKNANKTMGTGSAKKGFSYDKKGENLDGEFRIKPKKMETKEASRTNSFVTSGKVGLRKGPDRTENRMKVRMKESVDQELTILREKNEEYRKALNVFRNKLNEVAVFNSNLAYATRLFTEHSTSKQEKINILRRFDNVQSLKESKGLYQTIKDELSVSKKQSMNESVERVIENTQHTGSAVNLIESKTYENPQFLRMKDLMAKIK